MRRVLYIFAFLILLFTPCMYTKEEHSQVRDISVESAAVSVVSAPILSEVEVTELESEIEQVYTCPFTDEEIELISLIVLAEAEGEEEYGKRLVVDTILNRMDNQRFPDTVTDIIYQQNQFSSVWNGRCSRVNVTEDIRNLVREEVEHRTNYDVIFFTAYQYGRYGTPLFQVGNHYFSSY